MVFGLLAGPCGGKLIPGPSLGAFVGFNGASSNTSAGGPSRSMELTPVFDQSSICHACLICPFVNLCKSMAKVSNLFPTMAGAGIPGKSGISSTPDGFATVPITLLTTKTLSLPHNSDLLRSNFKSGMKALKTPVIILKPSIPGPSPAGLILFTLNCQSLSIVCLINLSSCPYRPVKFGVTYPCKFTLLCLFN